jgi:two-component system chemotaxis response regulator CheY
MIVDDSISMRQIIAIALKGAGYSVIESFNGKDALSKLTDERIHLFISDLNMPGMDGFGFVRALKEKPAYKFAPVLMLTTETQEHKKQEGKAAGVRAWMSKPFQVEQLLAAVEKLALA